MEFSLEDFHTQSIFMAHLNNRVGAFDPYPRNGAHCATMPPSTDMA